VHNNIVREEVDSVLSQIFGHQQAFKVLGMEWETWTLPIAQSCREKQTIVTMIAESAMIIAVSTRQFLWVILVISASLSDGSIWQFLLCSGDSYSYFTRKTISSIEFAVNKFGYNELLEQDVAWDVLFIRSSTWCVMVEKDLLLHITLHKRKECQNRKGKATESSFHTMWGKFETYFSNLFVLFYKSIEAV